MTRRLPLLVLVCVAAVVGSQCGPTGMPMLSVSGPTSAYRDGTPITLRVVATLPDGKVGSGRVTVTTDVGVVVEEGLTLDEFGTASFTFACNVTTNPDCVVDSANLKLRWATTPPVAIDYTVRLTARPSGGDGGTGGGGSGVCISNTYSRTACAGAGKPDVRVLCCLNMTPDQIPNCSDVYACNGMRVTRTFQPFSADAGAGPPVEFEMEFQIPTFRPRTYAECMQQQVGMVVRQAGNPVGRLVVADTYGWVDLQGDYFSFRITESTSLRSHEDRECLSVADGGVLGVWHSMGDGFTLPRMGAQRQIDYVPVDPPRRYFFMSLLKP